MGGKKNAAAARQNLRPAMHDFLPSETGQTARSAARRRNYEQAGTRRIDAEYDVVVGSPTRAAQLRGQRADGDGGAAVHGYLLHPLSIRKGDPLTVGGKERIRRAFGSGQHR